MSIQAKVGWRSFVANNQTGIDTDAQAFITAASITDSTQQSAINTLVTQLKTYGIWTKMKALYPFVGGNATSHKFNLKDPRDLDAAYRLIFNGGWVHSATGAKPNGSNGYAMTYLSPSTSLTNNNYHLSYYSREQITTGNSVDMGCSDTTTQMISATHWYQSANVKGCVMGSFSGALTVTSTNSNTLGLLIGTRTSSTLAKQYMNGVQDGASVTTLNTYSLLSRYVVLGGNYVSGGVTEFTTRQSAFASIGDGLTDAEATNFYNAVQTFQSTLGRQVGVPIVADTDAQAFLNAASITDSTQASAVNTLVTQLKTYGIWTKMKALYPFVGGNATSHKFNLKDPRDLDAAYRLVFNGGWVHSATGALPNGTTGYADTFLVPSSVLNETNFAHLSYYSNTSTGFPFEYVMGSNDGGPAYKTLLMIARRDTGEQSFYSDFNNATYRGARNLLQTNGSGLFLGTQQGANVKLFRQNVLQASNTNIKTSTGTSPFKVYIGGDNDNGTARQFTNKLCSLASIGDGLTDTEAANFYTAVQTYQTTLGRNVGAPIVADTDAQAFLNAAEITSQTQASAINTLVTSLKSAGIWTKMKALYPFVGGTATSHKFNLKDPRDLDAAFRLVFNGGSTHDSNGYSTNGNNSYADTKLKPSVNLALNSASFGVYSTRERVGWDRYVMGTLVGPGWILFRIKSAGNTTSNVIHSDWSGGSGVTNASAKGFFQMSRVNTTQIISSINNNNYVNTGNATAMSTGNVYINGVNGLDIGQSSDNINYTYAYIADGLTSSELSAHNTIIQAYQTTLGRQV
jgi:hypothetical protein